MSWSYHDIELYNLTLNGSSFQTFGLDIVTRADFELTIDGASHIDIEFADPNNTLLQSGALSRTIRLKADDDFYDLVQVSKSGRSITCTFESMAVVALRGQREPRKAASGTVTRAEFVRMLVSELPWIKFVLPLNISLPTAQEELTRGNIDSADQSTDPNSIAGLGDFSAVTSQVDRAAIGAGLGGIADLVSSLHLTPAEVDDSGLVYSDATPPDDGATTDDGSDPEADISIDGIITDVSAPKKLTKKKRQIAADPTLAENTWDASGRIANAVNDLRFVRKLEFWYVTYAWLMLQTPVATFREYTDGVDFIDFDFDIGKPIATATIECRADAWDIPPGNLVTLRDIGPAVGNWIVKSVKGNFFNKDLTVDLIQPLPRLEEPVGTTSPSTGGGLDGGLPPLQETTPAASATATASAGLTGIDSLGPLDLVKIGQGGHQLRADAAAAFARVEKRVGRTVFVTDSFRTYAQQADLYKRKPNLAAKPGTSGHEKGICVDIVEMQSNDIKNAFTAEDWHQFNRAKEPWHWSYHVTT
jgi:hypothetical protein